MSENRLDLRKQSWLLKPSNTSTRLWFVGSKLTCVLATCLSKIWFNWLNNPRVHNRDEFVSKVETDEQDCGIITVSNHHCCMDDPLLWGILKWRHIFFKRMRYIPAAEEVCFTRTSHILFFSLGRCVPIVRGHGVYQRGMDYCLEKLAEKQWVHIFAEGKVNTTKENMRLKWGVGRLVSDCDITPCVLPIFHVDWSTCFDHDPYKCMKTHFSCDVLLTVYRLELNSPQNMCIYVRVVRENIVPKGEIPCAIFFKNKVKVTVLVGDTLDFTNDVAEMKRLDRSKVEMRKYITDRIEEEIHLLSEKANELHRTRFQND